MVDRVLIPVEGSEFAEQATQFVIDAFPEATIIFLHVINPAEAGYSAQATVPSFSEEWYKQERERTKEQFEELAQQARNHGLSTEQAIEVGKPSSTIVEFANENGVDHIVMGTHGRKGMSRILLGSVAEAVIRRSSVPVTVVR